MAGVAGILLVWLGAGALDEANDGDLVLLCSICGEVSADTGGGEDAFSAG